MRAFTIRTHGWRLVILSMAGAAACSASLYGWTRHHWAADFPQPAGASSDLFAPAPSGKGAPTAPPTPRQRALAQLEAAGSSFDGTSFVRAVASRHQPLIDLFQQAGIDINVRDAHGRTALLVTALDRNWPLFDRLLASGARPNLADTAGVTPLMAAALTDRSVALTALLQHGAELNAVDTQGRNAAHYAIAGKQQATLLFLLGKGIDTEGSTHDLLVEAYETGDWKVIEPILSRATLPLAWEPHGLKVLEDVLTAQDEPKMRLLLSKYTGLPSPVGSTQPVLAHLIVTNDLPRFQFLLKCGADPNTPLVSPVEKAFAQLVPQAGFRDYVVSDNGLNVLMLAAGMGRPEFVQALLDKGAKRFTATEKYKMIPLYFAAQGTNPRTVQILLGEAPTPEQVHIEISLGAQRATVMRFGQSILSTEVSTGRPGFSTPTGDFVITDKHLSHKSSIYKAEMPFFMRLNCRDFGMHQGVLPGHAASHGCIRLPEKVARQLFKEIPVGTLVSIRE